MNCKNTNKLVAGVLIGAIALSVGTLDFFYSNRAFASTKGYVGISCNVDNDMKENQKYHHGKKCLQDKLDKLDKLVESGKITSEQKDKVIAHIEKKHKERKEEIEKLKGMSKEQRNAYFDQIKANTNGGFFKELIDEKVITEKQANEIKKAMHKNHKHKFNERKFKAKLDEQVKAGVISKDEANKIMSHTKKRVEERKAQKNNIKKMTPGERRVHFLQKELEPKKGFFKDLVDQGILSQQKADALKKAMHQHND